jgi:hypothetical protein
MKTWLLVLIVSGQTEYKVAEFETLPECSKAGSEILGAAYKAYGEPTPELSFKCSKN